MTPNQKSNTQHPTSRIKHLISKIIITFAILLLTFQLLIAPISANTIPTQNQWLDVGMIIDSDATGDTWPMLYEGITPGALVKKDNTYYLYYIGATNYITQKNNIGPANRNVGVATSTNGINWTPHPGNPIITYTSTGNPEEGAVSLGVYVDTAGIFHAYFGANKSLSLTSPDVNANVFYATSANGLNFTVNNSPVLVFNNSNVWGYGDELHAVGAWWQGNTWYTFYVPNGVASQFNRRLGVAWGNIATNLSNSTGVKLCSTCEAILSGPMSIVPLSSSQQAIFTTRSRVTQVHTANVSNPNSMLTGLVTTYDNTTPGFGRTFYLDQSTNTWFMAYDMWTSIGLMVAPNGTASTTPPSSPPNLTATSPDAHTVNLAWNPTSHPSNGIAQYKVYKNGTHVSTTTRRTYQDTNLSELTQYTYAVRAVSFHKIDGSLTQINHTTPADTIPPAIASIRTGSNLNQVIVTFTEPVDQSSATNPNNYQLNHNLAITGVQLSGDNRVATLATTTQINNLTYTLEFNNILDRANTPNIGSGQRQFTATSLGNLAGYYRLDQNTSHIDFSGGNSPAQVVGSPNWTTGKVGTAINLNGINQFLHLPHTPTLNTTFSNSYTISAWVNPNGIPPDTTASNNAYILISGPSLRMQFSRNTSTQGRFVARANTSSGNVTLTSSNSYNPNNWYHFSMAVDNSSKQVRLLIHSQNGTQLENQSASYTGNINQLPSPQTDSWSVHGSDFRIGVQNINYDYDRNFFKGAIDDFRIYNRALANNEVQSLAQITDPSPPTPIPTGIPTPTPHPADRNNDGIVNIFDLNHVIANFTSLTLSAYQTVLQFFGKSV